jgi:hypothetical protein
VQECAIRVDFRFFPTPLAVVASFVALALASACSAPPEEAVAQASQDPLNAAVPAPVQQPAPAAVFTPATKRVVFEVDYGPGAEPYALSTTTIRDPWAIFRDNARAVLGAKMDLVVPSRLADMQRLDDVDATTFTRDDLIAISKKHRDTASGDDTIAFYLLFLNGKFKDDSGKVVDSTVGLSVRGTGIIAMFKPVITAGWTDPVNAVFMEQTTLVHEFGHAVGLVGDGISTTSAHRDDAHGAHCSNPKCVMYWRNDMVGDDVDFVATHLAPNGGVLFGDECIADARAASSQQGGEFAWLSSRLSLASKEPTSLVIDE